MSDELVWFVVYLNETITEGPKEVPVEWLTQCKGLDWTLKTFLYIIISFYVLPDKFEVWLQFNKVYRNKAKYNIYCKDVAVKDGNKTKFEEQMM